MSARAQTAPDHRRRIALLALAALPMLALSVWTVRLPTVYAGLSYTQWHTLLDCVKIDRSFVNDIPGDVALTRAIIAMGHSLGLHVVAEAAITTLLRKMPRFEIADTVPMELAP